MEWALAPPLLPFAGPRLIGSRMAVEASGRSENQEGVLAGRIAAGDELALEEVYDEFSGPVFAFLVSRMREREAAEDVLQQVFFEVWQKAGNFDPRRGRLVAWIMAIANSRSLDFLRKKVPEPRDPVSLSGSAGDSDPGGIDRFLADWEFARTIENLPEPEAELLRMRFCDDLSQSDISKRTGMPLGTVKSRMVSGLNALREAYEVR